MSQSWTEPKVIVPWIGMTLAVAYAIWVQRKLTRKRREQGFLSKGQSNFMVRKDEAKVVDTVYIEDLGQKKSICRCWASKKWPFCDGAHKFVNKELGDNTGPLILKSKNWKPKERRTKSGNDKKKKR